MVTLHAVRARSGQSLALFATGTLTVAGCVVGVGYSRAAHVSIGSAGALLLLGIVALAAQGGASVRAQRYEIALAQLRGRHGLGLLRDAVTESSLILVAAAVAGTAVGWAVGRASVRRWVAGGAAFEMTGDEWATAAVVLAVSVVVVVVVSWRTIYEPLTAKLDNRDRPRPATAAGLFLSLLVVMGAAVSVYQSRQLGVRHANWVSFLSPALVGLAAGQLGLWLVALLSRLAMGSPSLNRRLRWFLTLRRLTRRADSVAAIRIVVAAVVVAGVAGSAWLGSEDWRNQMARIETGGEVAFAVPAGGLRAYVASHEADPQGQWLMAVSASPDPSAGSDRDVFVDTPRWDRVVGSFFTGTPVAEVSSEIGGLFPDEVVRPARGNTFSVTFTALSADRAWPNRLRHIPHRRLFSGFARLQFAVTYVDAEGDIQVRQVPQNPRKQPVPVRPGLVGYSASIPGCARGCAIQTLSVQGLTPEGPLRITSMSFGDLPLLSTDEQGLVLSKPNSRLRGEVSKAGLDLWVTDPYTSQELLSWTREAAPAALATPGLRLERSRGETQASGLDGEERPVQVAAEVPALPLLGRAGLLLDLGTGLRGAGGQVPETETFVVARADTPADVLDRLMATGAVESTLTVEEALADIRRSGNAQASALYALIAVFGLLIAAVSVVSSTVEQRRQRRGEAASLRVVGVDTGDVTRGYRTEAEVLGAAVTVVAGVAVWFGCRALLGVLPLVDPGEFGLTFDATPKTALVASLSVVAGAFVALVVFFGFRLVGRSSPPSMLRDDYR